MGKPLAVRWRAHELPELRAGALATARVELENAGRTAWRGERFTVSYHWLDELGNAIVWDGLRSRLDHPVEPGERTAVDVQMRAPIPPGRYRLSIDLVDEKRFWFGELGSPTLDVDADVLPRIDDLSQAAARLDGAVPAPDWAERVLAAHREGYAVVGGAVEASRSVLSRAPRELEPYSPGAGRVPDFAHPLVCPSVVRGVDVEWTEVAGLPAAIPPPDEPSLFDGRIRVSVRQ